MTSNSNHKHITKYELYMYLSKNREDEEWVNRYKEKVQTHNNNIIKGVTTLDSGFDLFMPSDGSEYGYGEANNIRFGFKIHNPPAPLDIGMDGARALNLGVKCCMRLFEPNIGKTSEEIIDSSPCGYYLYPRSSISKTRMRLANSVGIIDSGYRGDIIAAVDTIGIFGSSDIWHIWKETLSPIKKYDRYFQICSPNLSPFLVHIVETESELGEPTARGAGGFGSTGL
jgi:dUTPase